MEFVLGFLGAVAAMLLFGAGILCGWRAKGATVRVTAEPLTEAQRRQMTEEREAWQALNNYGVEDAYNIRPETPAGKAGEH